MTIIQNEGKRAYYLFTIALLIALVLIKNKAICANTYNPGAAVNYAHNHYGDSGWVCTDLVNYSIREGGGLTSYSSTRSSTVLRKNLLATGLFTEYKLSISKGKYTSSDEISPGDAIFFTNPNSTGYGHTALVTKVSTYIYYTQANPPYKDICGKQTNYSEAYVLHYSGSRDTTAPEILNYRTENISLSGYDISFAATDNEGITSARVATWTEYNNQDDLKWSDANKVTGGRYKCHISVSDHGNEEGRYISDIYVYDAAGNQTSQRVETVISSEKPVIQDVQIHDKASNCYRISCLVTGGNVTKVCFPTWTTKSGQDDIEWPEGYYRNGRWECWIACSEHNNEEGYYVTNIYADYPGGTVSDGGATVYIDKTSPEISDITVENKDSDGYDISCVVKDNGTIKSVRLATWTPMNNGNDDLKWDDASYSDGRWRCHVNTFDHSYEEGEYTSVFYVKDDCNNETNSEGICPYIFIDRTAPVISDVRYDNISSGGYDISCQVEDESDIKYVQFVVRTPNDEYLTGYGRYEDGRYCCRADLSETVHSGGMYYNAVFAEDLYGNIQGIRAGSVEIPSSSDGNNNTDKDKSASDNNNRMNEDDESVSDNNESNSLSDNSTESISENHIISEDDTNERSDDNDESTENNDIIDQNEPYNSLVDLAKYGYISKTIYYQGLSNESVSMNITVNGSVSYNGKKHVSVRDGSGKSKSGDLDITVSGNVPENLEVVFKYKNNKSVTGKTPYFYIMLKGYGLEKEEKKWLKAVNKKLKKPENRVEFKINPYNISGRDIRVCTYEDLDGNVKIRKVTVDLDGRNVKLCKKDYKAEVGRNIISITGKRNYTGSAYVVLR